MTTPPKIVPCGLVTQVGQTNFIKNKSPALTGMFIDVFSKILVLLKIKGFVFW